VFELFLPAVASLCDAAFGEINAALRSSD